MPDPDEGATDPREIAQILLALRNEVGTLRQEVNDLHAGVVDAVGKAYQAGCADERAAHELEERPPAGRHHARHRRLRDRDGPRPELRVVRAGLIALPAAAGVEWVKTSVAAAAVGAVLMFGGGDVPHVEEIQPEPGRGALATSDPASSGTRHANHDRAAAPTSTPTSTPPRSPARTRTPKPAKSHTARPPAPTEAGKAPTKKPKPKPSRPSTSRPARTIPPTSRPSCPVGVSVGHLVDVCLGGS